MWHLKINKVAKLLARLIITSSLIFSYFTSQSQSLSPKDSINLKKDLDSILNKYGFKNNPYVINVQSKNQKGGQTAFIINNNYYGDSVLSPTNFSCKIDTLKDGYTVTVYPLKGTWQMPYIGVDTIDYNKNQNISYDPGFGSINFVEQKVTSQDTLYYMICIIRNDVCSKNYPMVVKLSKINVVFTFGDFTDDNKCYIFNKGVIANMNNNKKD